MKRVAFALALGALRLSASAIDPSILWSSGPDLYRWVLTEDYGYQPISVVDGRTINRIEFGENPIPPAEDAPAWPAPPMLIEQPLPPVSLPPASQDTPEPHSLSLLLIGACLCRAARSLRKRRRA